VENASGRVAAPSSGPPATGVRAAWESVPAGLRAAVEAELGAPVAEARTQHGGFSPGVAARLRLTDGRRAFVKAVSAAVNPDSPGFHRAEAAVSALLPASVPAPRLLAAVDRDGWVLLAFEDIEGTTPALPWDPADLDRVLAAVADLARLLTPTPVDVAPAAEALGDAFRGWRQLAADAAAGRDDLAGLDPWARRHLADLAALEERWPQAAAGQTLAHGDLRADNMLLTAAADASDATVDATGGRVVFVDWPSACVAAPWFDLVLLLPSVRMQGGPPAAGLFDAHPVAVGADPAAVTAVLAAFAGMLVFRSRQPAPPALPTLRPFQAAQGRAALEWLRTRTGWA
jgi:aminoglycoside phosphotransferase (APT) family kinase protein